MREGVNISRPTEEALKEALDIEKPRTAKEHLQKLLAEVGSEVSFYGQTYFLPLQVESLKLTKVGPFDNFEAHFRRNSINLIYGLCGSGKSIIMRSILFAFGIRHRYFTEKVFGEGEITLRLFPEQDSINIAGIDSRNATRGYQCLIADDPLDRLSRNMIVSFLAELKNLGIQIIMTASPLIEITNLSKDMYIIPL